MSAFNIGDRVIAARRITEETGDEDDVFAEEFQPLKITDTRPTGFFRYEVETESGETFWVEADDVLPVAGKDE